MKKYLLLLVLPFLFLNNVYAEEYKSCFDQYKIGNVTGFTDLSAYWKYVSPPIPASSPSTYYYVRFFGTNPYTGSTSPSNPSYFHNSPLRYDSNMNSLGTKYTPTTSFDVTTQVLSFQTQNTANMTNVAYYQFSIATWNSNYQDLLNTPVIVSTNLEDVLSCEDSPSDNVYSSFITLYLDRISYLANGFITNPYLLSMAGIIFAFIVLELFLHIFHIKGGYRK